jgi:hypothetical protein
MAIATKITIATAAQIAQRICSCSLSSVLWTDVA